MISIWDFKKLPKLRPKRVLLDVGMHKIFRELGYREYPQWFLDRYIYIAKNLMEKYGENLLVIMPDYPYHKILGKKSDNYIRTYNLAKELMREDGINWLPVVQWNYDKLWTFEESLELFAEIIDRTKYFAVPGGPLPIVKMNFANALHMARKSHPNARIHAFGLKLSHKRFVDPTTFDSFDTSTGTHRFWRFRRPAERKDFYIHSLAITIEKLRDAYGPFEE
jgi:hypothetical protein